ncbi:MAG: hypothetical protein HYZ00_11005, partial [Candidatus Hydrogenedentes bacterium]|nr:hypothetical protein [Candidatus Hydrogenedentota bacterium]
MASAAPDLPRAAVRPTLRERLRPSLLRRLARSPLTYTLVLSTLFHLSMVTLFKVMIYFQQQEGQYYALQIIPETLPEPELEVAAVFPPPPSEGNLRLDGIDRALPDISLPTLEFAELERMREIYGGRVLEEQAQLSAGSLYERLYGGASQDSWAASVRGLHKLGESLTSLSWEQDALPKKAGAPEEPLP